jgi:hypothetical protein
MSIRPEIKERLAERLKEMKDATTPTELAYTIWTKKLEEAMGLSREPYRYALVTWIWAYKDNTIPPQWAKYKTPEEIAEAVWEPTLELGEEDRLWFGSLRSGLVEWINNYCG